MRRSFSSEKKTSTSGTPKYLTSRKTVILPRVDAAMHKSEPSTAPEGVACGDLERLAGQNGDHDLKNDHAHVGKAAPYAVIVHPLTEFFRLRCKSDKRNARKPYYQCYCDNGDGYRRYADVFLLLLAEMFSSIVQKRISPAGPSYIKSGDECEDQMEKACREPCRAACRWRTVRPYYKKIIC